MSDMKNPVDAAAKVAENMRDAGSRVMENGSAMGVRMLEQAEANTREAFAAMRAAATAKDLSAVMQIQGDFLRAQSARSFGQAREIGELIMAFGRAVVTPVTADKTEQPKK